MLDLGQVFLYFDHNEDKRTMKNILMTTATLFLALMIGACGGAADNRPAGNTNAANAGNANAANANSAAKTAAPTKDALLAIEKKAWEDWANRRVEGLETYMAANFVNVGYNGASVRADAMKSWTSHKCEMKDLVFSDDQMTELAEGVALLTFKAKADIKCDGKSGPDPTNVSVLYVKEGDAWKAAYYQEVPAADAKGEYTPSATPVDKAKELASLSAAPDDIVENEKKLWSTWQARDQAAFRALITDNFVGNGRTGALIGTEAYMKSAFGTECKVESISMGPVKAMEISKDLTMIVYRATQKGACGNDKLPENVMSTSIYKRENGKPKAMYYMENPVRN